MGEKIGLLHRGKSTEIEGPWEQGAEENIWL
jgi:hypothetical protein